MYWRPESLADRSDTARCDGLSRRSSQQTRKRLDGLIARIHQQHPDLFDPRTGEMIVPSQTGPAGRPAAKPQSDEAAPDHQEG